MKKLGTNYAEDLAATMLASTLGIPFNLDRPELRREEADVYGRFRGRL